MARTRPDAPYVISSKEVYKGSVFDVVAYTIAEGGTNYQRDVVHHPGSAAIVPLYDDGSVMLVKQYRQPAVKYLLEIPAGSLDEDESPEDGAKRELEEEVGVVADKLTKLTEFFLCPGYCEEKMWLFLATGLHATAQRPEDDEILELLRVPLQDALDMISSGEIEDSKTIAGLLLTAKHLSTTQWETTDSHAKTQSR
jgi:ADP-ribose pyrophosphatase